MTWKLTLNYAAVNVRELDGRFSSVQCWVERRTDNGRIGRKSVVEQASGESSRHQTDRAKIGGRAGIRRVEQTSDESSRHQTDRAKIGGRAGIKRVEQTSDGSSENQRSSRHQTSQADIRRIERRSAVEQASGGWNGHSSKENPIFYSDCPDCIFNAVNPGLSRHQL